jgi:hypothetical protein
VAARAGLDGQDAIMLSLRGSMLKGQRRALSPDAFDVNSSASRFSGRSCRFLIVRRKVTIIFKQITLATAQGLNRTIDESPPIM